MTLRPRSPQERPHKRGKRPPLPALPSLPGARDQSVNEDLIGSPSRPPPLRGLEAPAALMLPLDLVQPWPGLAKAHTEAAIAELADLMRRFGLGAPLLVWPEGGAERFNPERDRYLVIGGHKRRLSALRAGFESYPCRVMSWLSEPEARAMALADNRQAERSAYDTDELAAQLRTLQSQSVVLDGLGWGSRDLSKLLARKVQTDDHDKQSDDQGDESRHLEALPKATRVELGDLWELGDHRLLCADSLKDSAAVLELVGGKVGLAITDPPYAAFGSSSGIGEDIADDKMIQPFFREIFRTLNGLLVPFAHAYVFCDWRSWASIWYAARDARGAHGAGLNARNAIVWDKLGGLGSNYANSYELIGFFHWLEPPRAMRSNLKRRGVRSVNAPNLMRYPKPSQDRKHNAQKPAPLLREILGHSSKPGDLVVDLFGGYGTTLIACEEAQRRARVVEIEPAWVEQILGRWEKHTGRTARKLGNLLASSSSSKRGRK